MPVLLPFAEGFLLGASLIIAIGAQNAFVLRQGLKREHVFVSAAFCSLADWVLIAGGVFGLGALVRSTAWFLPVMTWGGAAFLTWYGVKAAVRALKTEHLGDDPGGPKLSFGAVIASLGAFTFLNPHVYLDTVLLLGGLGARHETAERPWFVAGAALASAAWFFGLAYGARLLVPLFRRPLTWRVLDGAIALVMLALAGTLAVSGLTGAGGLP
jgi:L-lysine exporter family protein LysE/ArgO